MIYTFEHEGKLVTIVIDSDNGHKFFLESNGNTLTRLIKGFEVNFNSRFVQVNWVEVLEDSAGNVLSSTPRSYVESSPARYEGLYNLTDFMEPAGDVYAKQAIKGVMERTLGVKPFDAEGLFLL